MVGAALTDIAGSSDVFSGGFITYSADAKKSQLEVSGEILETFGEVSLATAWAMAAGALTNSDADVAVAITGIAGDRKSVVSGKSVYVRVEYGGSRLLQTKKKYKNKS